MAVSTIDKEVEEAVKKLQIVGKGLKKTKLQKPLIEGGKVLRDEARKNIPTSDKPHSRWNTGKLVAQIRAPKGLGKKIATYFPGNLKRALQVMKFRKSKAVFVGWRVDKKFVSGGSPVIYQGKKVDGYYAVMREEIGNKPMRRAVQSSKGRIGKRITEEVTRVMSEIERAVKIT